MCNLKAIKVFIALLSSLAVLGGFVIMGFTFYMMVTTQWLTSGVPSQLTSIAQIVSAVAITVGGLGVLFGILGLATLKFRHLLILVPYGIAGFLLTAIYTLAALALVYLYNIKQE
jgi:hypothetical protein